MKSLEITVNKLLVYNEVAMATGYKGAKEGAYDKVFATDADRLKLESFWMAGCDELVEGFGTYLNSVVMDGPSGMNVSTNDLKITLSLPDAYNNAFDKALSNDCFLYLADYVVARWFDLVDNDASETYMLLAVTRLEHIRKTLNKRKSGSFCQIKGHLF